MHDDYSVGMSRTICMVQVSSHSPNFLFTHAFGDTVYSTVLRLHDMLNSWPWIIRFV